jgi:hypothetical protein
MTIETRWQMSANEYVAIWLHSQQVFGPLAVVHTERNAMGEVMPHVKIAGFLAAATDR